MLCTTIILASLWASGKWCLACKHFLGENPISPLLMVKGLFYALPSFGECAKVVQTHENPLAVGVSWDGAYSWSGGGCSPDALAWISFQPWKQWLLGFTQTCEDVESWMFFMFSHHSTQTQLGLIMIARYQQSNFQTCEDVESRSSFMFSHHKNQTQMGLSTLGLHLSKLSMVYITFVFVADLEWNV